MTLGFLFNRTFIVLKSRRWLLRMSSVTILPFSTELELLLFVWEIVIGLGLYLFGVVGDLSAARRRRWSWCDDG